MSSVNCKHQPCILSKRCDTPSPSSIVTDKISLSPCKKWVLTWMLHVLILQIRVLSGDSIETVSNKIHPSSDTHGRRAFSSTTCGKMVYFGDLLQTLADWKTNWHQTQIMRVWNSLDFGEHRTKNWHQKKIIKKNWDEYIMKCADINRKRAESELQRIGCSVYCQRKDLLFMHRRREGAVRVAGEMASFTSVAPEGRRRSHLPKVHRPCCSVFQVFPISLLLCISKMRRR